MQLAVGQALLTSPDATRLFTTLARELNEIIAWDVFTAARVSDWHTLLCQRKDPDGRLLSTEGLAALRDAASLDEVSFGRALQALRPLSAEAGVYAGPALDALCSQYQLLRVIRQLYNVRSALCLPVPLAGDEVIMLLLFSHHPYGLGEASLALLQRLSPQLTLALQNQAAFAEIVALKQQLEAEKTYLV